MKEFRIGQDREEELIKIYLNKHDDFILLNQNDAKTVEKYTLLIEWFDKKQTAYNQDIKEFTEKYKGRNIIEEKEDGDINIDTEQLLAFSALRVNACVECCKRIDELIGEGTIKKYFRDHYEVSEDFIPDEDCIIDFFEETAPVFGQIFGKRTDRLKSQYSKNRKGKHTKTKVELIAEYKEKKEADANE